MILNKKSFQPQKPFINVFTNDESDEEELLGLAVDKELNFSKHTDKLCCNAQYKRHTLKQIKYLSLEKAKMLGKESQRRKVLRKFNNSLLPDEDFVLKMKDHLAMSVETLNKGKVFDDHLR